LVPVLHQLHRLHESGKILHALGALVAFPCLAFLILRSFLLNRGALREGVPGFFIFGGGGDVSLRAVMTRASAITRDVVESVSLVAGEGDSMRALFDFLGSALEVAARFLKMTTFSFKSFKLCPQKVSPMGFRGFILAKKITQVR
jgi:hypothetical protein